MDGRNAWNDDPPVNSNKQWFPHGFKVVQDFVRPQYQVDKYDRGASHVAMGGTPFD